MYKKLIVKDKKEFPAFYKEWSKDEIINLFDNLRRFEENKKIFKINNLLFKIYYSLFYIYNLAYIVGIYVSIFYLRDTISPVYALIPYYFFYGYYFLSKKYYLMWYSKKYYSSDFNIAANKGEPFCRPILDIFNLSWYYLYLWSIIKDSLGVEKTKILIEASGLNTKKASMVISTNDLQNPCSYFLNNMGLPIKTASPKNNSQEKVIVQINVDDKLYKKYMTMPMKMVKYFKWTYFICFLILSITTIIGLTCIN